MRLRELEARFVTLVREERELDICNGDPATWTPEKGSHVERRLVNLYAQASSLAEAHGLWFLCPKCFAEKDGPRGVHSVLCWFVGKVPDEVDPKPGRWMPSGTGIDDLTFVGPSAASVFLSGPEGCGWHGYVKDGAAE